MRPLHVALPLLVLALVAGPVALGGGTGTPTFRLSTPPASGPELNVGVAPDGHLFVGGWSDGGPSIVKSADGGVTWTSIPPTQDDVSADRVLVVDHDTGRVLVADTVLAGCSVLSWTDDEGASWLRNVACGGMVTDHEKVAFGHRTTLADPTGALYPNVMYVCANGLVADECAISPDGGVTFTPGTLHGTNCAFQGAPVADAAGTLYEGSYACGANLRYSTDNGLTWTSVSVPVTTSGDTASVPSLAVTPDGTLYYLYQTPAFHVAYVTTKDHGLHWSASHDVTPAGVTSTAFGLAVGGQANGSIGVAFYGTTSTALGWAGEPGAAPASVAWQGYAGVVTGADTATPTPLLAQVTPTSDPLHYGCVGKDAGCGGTPIADYMGLDVGPDGKLAAVFVDACPAGCTSHAQSTHDDALVAVQTGGTDLS
jgi:hypothetical protein